jgi:outer membrane receptor for ferrienterochelin and colicins
MANVAKDLDFGIDFTFNQGEYVNPRGDWVDTQYEDISMYISRFPISTSNFKIEYSPKQWNFALTGNYTGKMYID